MTHEELTIHVEVLEERLAKVASALIVLLEAIDSGNAEAVAFEIRQELAPDFASDAP